MEKMSPFDVAKNINEKLGELTSDDIKENYNPFIVNKIFSMTQDTVFFANELNRCYNLDKDMQYRFYYLVLNKKKRYAKWNKKEKAYDESELNLIKQKYNYSTKRATEAIELLTRQQINSIKAEFEKGGKNRVKRSD